MKLELLRDKFLEATIIAERFSSRHVSLPILSQILLTATKNTLTIKATNLDVGIEICVPTKYTDGDWSFAVSPQALKSFLSNISSKSVFLDYEANTLLITAPESTVSVAVVAPDDFPIIPKVTDGEKFSLPSKVYVDGVNSVAYSASISTIKPELSSIYIYPANEEIVFVATDSFRLAEKRIKMPKNNIHNPILLPHKNALEISKVLDSLNEDIEIVSSKNQISFKCDNIYISSRAVDGVFPDYKQIIPKDFSAEVSVLKEDLNKALKLTSGFVDSFQQVVFSVFPANKNLVLKTKGGVFGEASQEIKVAGSGADITVTFNHRYLAECLQSIKSESVAIRLVGPNKPAIIAEASHPSFTYLVMPMNR